MLYVIAVINYSVMRYKYTLSDPNKIHHLLRKNQFFFINGIEKLILVNVPQNKITYIINHLRLIGP